MSNIKILACILGAIALLVIIPVGCFQVKRSWNYYFGYETQVKESICSMVKPEAFKNPEVCE